MSGLHATVLPWTGEVKPYPVDKSKALVDYLGVDVKEVRAEILAEGAILLFNREWYAEGPPNENFEQVREVAPFAPRFKGDMVLFTMDKPYDFEVFQEQARRKWAVAADPDEKEAMEFTELLVVMNPPNLSKPEKK